MGYRAPLEDHRLLMQMLGFGELAKGRFAEATAETAEAVLTEAARLSEEILAPLNRAGDLHPARLENGVVRTSPGFAEGFRALAQGGWIGIAADPVHGGMGLPMTLATAVNEFTGSACLALQLNPLMTQGQIEALEHHASPEIQGLYIPRLISGDWTATMNLTEAQAGSDVGALRTRAEPLGDGTYAVTGEKIFITWADNDFASNICHLVLARLPDAAPGTKGISLFMVPKVIPNPDGSLGARNALRVVRLEHKLGLHGSPTAVMAFDGAKGWMIGEPGKGMAAMFTMMNNARLGVGVQGVSVAEAACQMAEDWARARVQGRTAYGDATIIGHPDVRRMLAEMRAETFSARAIALACAMAIDRAKLGDSPARAAFLTPIAKAYGTETGHHVAQLGIQVHGGMGFIEETGAAQLARDIRVTLIYEGTNGIQALDLVGRKMMDEGAEALSLIAEMRASGHAALTPALEALEAATHHLLAQSPLDRAGAATAYLRAYAQVLGAYYHLQAAALDPSRAGLARFVTGRLLPRHAAFLAEARVGSADLDPFPG
ncbi:acyl-CoA dehydrogenase [Stagnihabitans tardus]|uniref:3-methylmercaptopropionyl-CoA dehydrogenase n=1 Tax=Stagnihabitans tardus TaxID=2699202 RepID=A0AAE4YC65_9RHOB|nr:acyl-CoA dehydrogenase family protein [Stagnihabitans tardus]NBZ86985.1 acyl-CoA dehydrogenase [Stagnihabitans tardus]